jgi:hypothetical protein
MESMMRRIHEARTLGDLEAILEQLSSEVQRMRSAGSVCARDAQAVANSLNQVRLVMSDLERIEVQRHGVSRDLAGRFLELDVMIRDIGNQLGRR